MKKAVSILLCLVLVLSIAACGKSDGDHPSDRVGSYKLYEMISEGETIDNDTLKTLGLDDLLSLELKEDGTGSMTSDGESENLEWDAKVIKDTTSGDEYEYTYKDGKLTLSMDSDTMVFTKK